MNTSLPGAARIAGIRCRSQSRRRCLTRLRSRPVAASLRREFDPLDQIPFLLSYLYRQPCLRRNVPMALGWARTRVASGRAAASSGIVISPS